MVGEAVENNIDYIKYVEKRRLEARSAVNICNIDDFIDSWHEGAGPLLKLHNFLGMTWEEYSIWVENSILPKDYNG